MAEHSNNSWLELSYEKRLILAYAPKPAALISFITVGNVAIGIYRNKEKMNKMYHRLALGMCICSAFNSSLIFFISWSIPYNTAGCIHASGSTTTCTVAGFLMQLGMVVQYYYVSLSIYVFMALRCEFQINKIQWIEKYLHVGVFIIPLATAMYITKLEMFNPIGMACWINSAPQGCDLPQYGPCTRGPQNPSIYVILLGVLPTVISLLVATSIIIACYVNEQKKYKKLMKSGHLKGKMEILERARRRKSMLIAKQGTSYLAVFYTTYIFPTVAAVVQVKTQSFVFPTLLLATIWFPLDGLCFTIAYVFLLGKCNLPPQIGVKQSKKPETNDILNQNNLLNYGLSTTSYGQITNHTLDSVAPSTTGKRQFRRQSWSVSSNREDLSNPEGQKPNGQLSSISRRDRQSFCGVSIFDGTDKEKWELFGVYVGSESESESLDDNELNDEQETDKFNETFMKFTSVETDKTEF